MADQTVLREVRLACRLANLRLTPQVLVISVARQELSWFRQIPGTNHRFPSDVVLHRTLRASTSKYGTGQVRDSYRTPLGLHRVAKRIGAGWPVGTVFRGRQPVGFTWHGLPDATIAHRILWLEGMEPGLNRGGDVDTYSRYIYIHGLSDEPTLGRPASNGCIHLAAADLIPLFDRVPVGTVVWITPR